MDDLSHDIWTLYRAGFIEASMRDDGEWVFSMSEKAKSMSDEEIKTAIESLDEYDVQDERNEGN